MKSINLDSRSKKRLRYASAKERSKKASADVYRSYKDRIAGGVTSASTRERFVHNPQQQQQQQQQTSRPAKRQRRQDHRQQNIRVDETSKDGSKTAVVKISKNGDDEDDEITKEYDNNTRLEEILDQQDDNDVMESSTFAAELDIAMDRNASEIFGRFNRQIWLLVRSLPELLHNLPKVIDILISYMLSPASLPERPTPVPDGDSPNDEDDDDQKNARQEFIINLATTDILHLLSVLARDLRHEIHPYLHTKILPRIINDLLNPPPPPPESEKQPVPLDVTIVEASFRCMAYIFKYNSSLVVNDMESMRQYYGMTLGNRRELVRRLSAETFAPLVRKMKNQRAKERHIRRVLRALAATARQAAPPGRILRRTQADAVDGLSQLCFQVVRGVSGQLHSDGAPMLRFLLELIEMSGDEKEDWDLIFDVVDGMMGKLCRHCNSSTFHVVSQEMFSVHRSFFEKFQVNFNDSRSPLPIVKHLKLIVKVATQKSGHLLEGHSDKDLSPLCDTVSKICSERFFASLSSKVQLVVLDLLCELWVLLQNRKPMKIRENIEAILNGKFDDDNSLLSGSTRIAKTLLPSLQDGSQRDKTTSLLLSTAAKIACHNADASLKLVFAIASANRDFRDETTSGITDDFSLFGSINGGDIISSEQQKTLIQDCLFTCGVVQENYARISVALRCAPFLVLSHRAGITETYNRVANWTIDLLSNVKTSLLVKALAMESFAFFSSKVLELSVEQAMVKNLTLLAIPVAAGMLFVNGKSLWVTRSVASLMPLIQTFSLQLSEDVDRLFDALVPNLRSMNHFLRLYTLQILCGCPLKSYVVDHADIDLSEDLDEEETFRPPGQNKRPSGGPVGPCRLLETLLKLEDSRVSLVQEKELLSLIGQVEVMARSGRLPVAYAEAACNHMLGVLHVKFAPLWPIAQKTISVLLNEYEGVTWSTFEAELVAVMEVSDAAARGIGWEDQKDDISEFQRHLVMCQTWEMTDGKDIGLFGGRTAIEDGVVPKFHATDEVTIMESVWKAAAMSHGVVVKHSRVIVPLFLGFLCNQLYPGQSNDQDARELHLEEFVSHENTDPPKGYILQKRLKAFLSVFAAVEGPQQLVHHRKLESVFRSFLAHQDTVIVELAFSCLLKFKLRYLVSYQELIGVLLKKGKLRSSLLDLTEEVSSERMDEDQRTSLIPIFSRILFGRLSAKAGKASSKDSPGARRAAVLSFLSVLCKENPDLFPFLYLMTRPFLPKRVVLSTIESFEADGQNLVLQSLMTTRCEDICVSGPVIEGFLHLLGSVISQLGYRVVLWIPQLTSVTIEICKLVAVHPSSKSRDAHDENKRVEQPTEATDTLRRGAIRTLCFHRLSDCFGRFASTVDFTQFSARLWDALDPSLELLPGMVVKSEDCPALLTLLRTMSEHDQLLDLLLAHESSVGAVVECIASTSMHSVIHSALAVIENLLTVTDGKSIPKGQALVRRYAPKLVGQFTKRLEGRDNNGLADSFDERVSKRGGSRSPTWRRELELLCHVSNFVADNDFGSMGDGFASSLCALLVPYLGPDRGTTDDEKLNVLGILSNISSHLNRATAYDVFKDLSGTLSPNKSREGIASLPVRQGIVTLIDQLAAKNPRLLPISSLLAKISSTDLKRVDEIDFDVVIPGLTSLSDKAGESTWTTLCTENESIPGDVTPLVNCCFHFLYNEDGVISRASFNGLRDLVVAAATLSQEANDDNEGWAKLVESVVLPMSRRGLESRNNQVRRYCTLLIRDIAKSFRNAAWSHVCGDLWQFCDDDNPDLDFFLGLTHVQVHRRARAFRRLRKMLSEPADPTMNAGLSSQSLVSVLIPLTLHPLYESNTNSEEGLALEAIATLGALARKLSWSKYHSILWSLLSQFDRHPDQERYLVGALCAMIDSFHYDILTPEEANGDTPSQTKTSVWRSLENRIIPKMEGILTKESTDKSGSRIKSLRPTIVLALAKLFQKFPDDFFESKLSNILAVICDVLRSRDSNSRDVARTTLAKVVCAMDLKYLGDVVRELAVTLNEGYKLHVRAATVHTILLELIKVYEAPSKEILHSSRPCFDRCVPALMDLLQDDLFGEANERRESQETSVRYVKEASGNKSIHSIELISRMIIFSPSSAADENQSKSSVHCVLSPFLVRLRLPDVDASIIRKIKEVLSRIVVGISNNKGVVGEELLPFIHATILPFIGQEAIVSIRQGTDTMDDTDADDDADLTIKVSGSTNTLKGGNQSSTKRATGNVVEWRPSTLQSSMSGKTAMYMKSNAQRQLRVVQDGLNAPKLTGSSRYGFKPVKNKAINEPATISGIVFGLNLLSACLKKTGILGENHLPMLDPFVPMLTALVCYCRNTEIALLALKCLQSFLPFDLPSVPSCSKSLGRQTLYLLSSSASSSNQNDLTQCCFKTLTYLINNDSVQEKQEINANATKSGEQVFIARSNMPLDSEQLKVLCSLLQVSIADTEQHNPALNLIKAMMSHRYMSPEFYDLMEAIQKLVVRSPKPNLRQQGAGIFVRYLLDYPMGEEKFEQHLKQAIANISYEFQDGRMSGVALLTLIIDKLPQTLLEKRAQMLFLPLVMQLLNDESKDCRQKVADCIKLLFARCSSEIVRTFQEYCLRWSKQSGPLRLASLQVFGLLIESRPDFLRSGSLIDDWVTILKSNLQHRQSSEWETSYFSILCLEKLFGSFKSVLCQQPELWSSISECLVDDHPWVKMSSSRILSELLSSDFGMPVCAKNKGLLFDVVRNLCVQLNAPEGDQNVDLTDLATRTLSQLLPMMHESPELCYKDDVGGETDLGTDAERDPVFWLMRRLSQIAKSKGRNRRLAVFKCYGAFATRNYSIVARNLELMLDGLHRTIVEGKNEIDNQAFSQKKLRKSSTTTLLGAGSTSSVSDEYSMAEEVLRLLEDSCPTSEEFLTAYASVKRRARDRKDQRKTDEKTQAVLDPKAFAEGKIQKQLRSKERKKRRSQEQRRERGGLEKRPRTS